MIKKGKLSLQSINSCMLVLDEDYPQAMPFKDTSTNPAEFNNPSDYNLALGPVAVSVDSLLSHARLLCNCKQRNSLVT